MLNIITEFIIEQRWNYKFEIGHETSLQDDLKIYGDDAVEILQKFCDKFNVDSSNFPLKEYFKGEDSWIDFFVKKKEYKNMTVGDLVKAVKNGSF